MEKLSDNTDDMDKNNRVPDSTLEDRDEDAAKHSWRKKSDLTNFKAEERQSAVDFIEELVKALPYLLQVMSAYDVDETLQKFASEFSARKCSMAYKHQVYLYIFVCLF